MSTNQDRPAVLDVSPPITSPVRTPIVDSSGGAVNWLVLPRLEVRAMNAQPAWWCVGAPGPMAARGFAEALIREVLGEVAHFRGVGLVLHDFIPRAEVLDPVSRLMLPHQHRGAALVNGDDYAQGSKQLSGQPTVRGDGCFSFVLALDASATIDLAGVSDFLDRGRFAGGSIRAHAFRAGSAIKDSWSDVLASVRGGFAFMDRSELVQQQIAEGAKDPLDAILACTRPVSAQQRRAKDFVRGPSWLAPYLSGYYALTEVAQRKWSRDGYPHAFVEPLIGLGQFVSVRQGVIPLWDFAHQDRAYIVQETAVYGGAKPPATQLAADEDGDDLDEGETVAAADELVDGSHAYAKV